MKRKSAFCDEDAAMHVSTFLYQETESDGMALQHSSPHGWNQPYGERPQKARRRYGGAEINADFRCAACGAWVTAAAWLSGVQNRNHCPHCLCSRHLDLHAAGDRLSACKGVMRPVGLTLKRERKKYAGAGGELMLAHDCEGCGKVSINRIAADDDAEAVMQVFRQSMMTDEATLQRLAQDGVRLLTATDAAVVRRRLLGV